MKITPIPCLSDNYAYLVECETSGALAIVDPGEAGPVRDAVTKLGRKPSALWATHHHHDHVGGNEELAAEYRVAVYGHVSDRGRIPAQTEFLEDGSSFSLGELTVDVLHVPGHTLGAVTYVVRDAKTKEAAAFTGDTFFLAGCGRLFEGSPAQMHASLTRIAAEGDHVAIYCGHEYTESNLRFAAHVEPENQAVATRLAKVKAARAKGEPTVPAFVAEEKQTNPFLRSSERAVRAFVAGQGGSVNASDVDVMAAVRKAKDSFKG